MSKLSKIRYSLCTRESQFARVQAPKTYANLQYNGKVNLSGLAAHMVEHGSKYEEGDILAILTNAVNCIKEMLLLGYKVELGKLGTFSNSIRQTGAASTSDYNPATNIIRLRARFSPGKALMDYKDEAEFEFVPIRKNQDLLKAAEKGGADMMSLYRVESGDGGGGNGGDDEDDEDENPEIIGQ